MSDTTVFVNNPLVDCNSFWDSLSNLNYCWQKARSEPIGWTSPLEQSVVYGPLSQSPPMPTINLSPGNTPVIPVNGQTAQASVDSIVSQNQASIQAGELDFFGNVASEVVGQSSLTSNLLWLVAGTMALVLIVR